MRTLIATIARTAALDAKARAAICLGALVLSAPGGLEAAPQQPAEAATVSLARIRERLEAAPTPRFRDVRVELPVAIFKSRVDQRRYVLSLEEELHKLFDLTPLERQQAELAAKCCGLDLIQLARTLNKALQRNRERRIREQIAQELAQLEAARK